MKITVMKQTDVLMPFDAESVEYVGKLKENSHFVIDIKRQRSPLFHGYAFKALTILYDMVETPLMFDPWRKMLTIKAGYFTAIGKVDIEGETSVAVVADSLSFASMDDDTFHKCLRALLSAFVVKYGKDITYDQLTEWSML